MKKLSIQHGNVGFDFFVEKWDSSDGDVGMSHFIAHTDHSFDYLLHWIGRQRLEIDWSLTRRDLKQVILIPNGEITYKEWLNRLRKTCAKMDSEESMSMEENRLKNNIDENTGKPLNLDSIRRHVYRMRRELKSKKISRQQVCDWFNLFNIEDDQERIRCGGAKMEVLTKSGETLIREGLGALERLYIQCKLKKQKKT